MEQLYRIIYDIKGVDNNVIEDYMKEELIRVYDIYAKMANDGVTDLLNKEFNEQYPNYKHNLEDWTKDFVYNQFMADGYSRLICDKLNECNVSLLMKFYVDPSEVQFMGYLKWDRNVTIEFYLKEA